MVINMENKVTVIAKDGQATVKIGADMIVLKDCTKSTFHTHLIDEFINYVCKSYQCVIYANDKSLHACRLDQPVEYNTIPVAICNLEFHPKTVFLTNKIKQGNWVHLKEMELLLDCLKDGLCSKGIQLLKYLRDFKLSAITDIERQKDNRGNYINSIKRTVRGKEEKNDYEFPEKIQFNIPLFNYDEHRVTVEVELKFDFQVVGEEVKLMWNLINFDLDTQLNEYAKAYIVSKLKEGGYEFYWGTFNIVPQTDEWCYLQNQVEDKVKV